MQALRLLWRKPKGPNFERHIFCPIIQRLLNLIIRPFLFGLEERKKRRLVVPERFGNQLVLARMGSGRGGYQSLGPVQFRFVSFQHYEQQDGLQQTPGLWDLYRFVVQQLGSGPACWSP